MPRTNIGPLLHEMIHNVEVADDQNLIVSNVLGTSVQMEIDHVLDLFHPQVEGLIIFNAERIVFLNESAQKAQLILPQYRFVPLLILEQSSVIDPHLIHDLIEGLVLP